LKQAELKQKLELMQTDDAFEEEDRKEKAAKIEEQAAKKAAQVLEGQINAQLADKVARTRALAQKAKEQKDAEAKSQAEKKKIAKREQEQAEDKSHLLALQKKKQDAEKEQRLKSEAAEADKKTALLEQQRQEKLVVVAKAGLISATDRRQKLEKTIQGEKLTIQKSED
jgi:hypothetical protein